MLRLGDVRFEGDDKGSAPTAEGARALEAAASLLGVGEADFRKQLTERLISVGSEDVTIPLAPDAARAARDACCKAIYQRLFTFYVHCLNVLLRPSSTVGASSQDSRGRSVGLLDIFGFESLQTNSLEQLCINYANEKLHALFLTHVFHGVDIELLERIIGDDTSGIDNTPCLALLESPPNGILHLLDHQCRSPNASEEAFCLAANQKHAASPFFTVPKLSRACSVDESGGFVVRHFAGDVLYCRGAFLELNNDTMSFGTTSLLQRSTEAFVSHLFSAAELQPPQPRRGASFASVGSRFTQDLNKLLRTLQATETHFIRCVKPNLQQLPGTFDSFYVRTRLQVLNKAA